MRQLAWSIFSAITPKGYEMRIHQYTREQLEVLCGQKVELKNYSNPYYVRELMFANVSKDGTCMVTNFCKESMCSYVRTSIENKTNQYCIGITVELFDTIESQNKSIRRVLKTTNTLHTIETTFGFRMHSLKCYTLKGNANQVMWVFNLDPKWYNSPPMLSYLLEIIRSSFKGAAVDKSQVMYKLLEERQPYEIFGKGRKLNWCIGRKNVPYEGSFNPTYGMANFSYDVRNKSKERLNSKFPEHDIFKEKQPGKQVVADTKVTIKE